MFAINTVNGVVFQGMTNMPKNTKNKKSGKTQKRSITLNGDLNIYNAGEVKDKLFGKLRDCNVLDVNLAKIEEFDTAGMQVLLLAKKFAQQQGVGFHIKDQSCEVTEVLQLYNVDI